MSLMSVLMLLPAGLLIHRVWQQSQTGCDGCQGCPSAKRCGQVKTKIT
ncbi:hypothetical protein [Atopomonas sediminilitoris]|nr:hypothetical protein [Atopomonas sediminilitoris]MCJ8170821.1 hypothetical protein [Atopomonas sediminilitoris]